MRIKPNYNFVQYCTVGNPLKGEAHSHVLKGKAKRVSSGSSAPSGNLGGDPVICSGVRVGSSRGLKSDAASLLGEALRKAGV